MKIGDLIRAIPNDPISGHNGPTGQPYVGIVVNKTFRGPHDDTVIHWIHLNIGVGNFHDDEWKFEVLSEVKK